MLVILLMLLSIPIGIFTAWFAWRAFKVGKSQAGWSMAWLSIFSFLSAAMVAFWVYAIAAH